MTAAGGGGGVNHSSFYSGALASNSTTPTHPTTAITTTTMAIDAADAIDFAAVFDEFRDDSYPWSLYAPNTNTATAVATDANAIVAASASGTTSHGCGGDELTPRPFASVATDRYSASYPQPPPQLPVLSQQQQSPGLVVNSNNTTTTATAAVTMDLLLQQQHHQQQQQNQQQQQELMNLLLLLEPRMQQFLLAQGTGTGTGLMPPPQGQAQGQGQESPLFSTTTIFQNGPFLGTESGKVDNMHRPHENRNHNHNTTTSYGTVGTETDSNPSTAPNQTSTIAPADLGGLQSLSHLHAGPKLPLGIKSDANTPAPPRQEQHLQQLQSSSLSGVSFSSTPFFSSLPSSSMGGLDVTGTGVMNLSMHRHHQHQPAPAPPPSLFTGMSTPMPLKKGSQATTDNFNPSPLPPLRALSAYNFFFRDERDCILHGTPREWNTRKQEELLRDHWARDRTKKRRHRKTHGKIDFTTLSKLISSRWKELPEERKDFYKQVAARDWERYQQELAMYKSTTTSPPSVTYDYTPVVG